MPLTSDSIETVVFENSPDAIVVADGQRIIQKVNPAFTALFGYVPDEVCGRSTLVIYAEPEDFERMGRRRREEDPGKPAGLYQVRYRRKDGSVFYSETTAKMVYDANGARNGHVAIIRDISERVKMQELLRSVVSLSSKADANPDETVRRFIRRGCDYFGMESGMVSHVDGEMLTVRYLVGGPESLRESDVRPTSQTFCGTVIEAGDVRSYCHAGLEEIAKRPCYAQQGLEAYIGCPLHIAGKPYGTLSFFGLAPRSTPFGLEDETLIAFLAEWLGGFLEQTRQRAELGLLSEQLAVSAETFRRLYHQTPAMLHSIDSEGVLQEASEMWLRQMGYRRDEVLGRSIMDFLTPDSATAAKKLLPEFWSGRAPFKDEPRQLVRKDGSILETEISSVIASKSAGKGRGRSFAVVLDVTERNRGRRALERSAKTFERLYRETPAMLHSVDLEGRLVEVSDYWLYKLGYGGREEVLGRPITDFHTPEQRERAARCVTDFWRTGEPVWNRPYDFLRKDGTTFEVDLSVIVANPKEDAEARSLAVSFDVTERNRARRQLELKNAELEQMSGELASTAQKFEKLYRETPAMLHSIDREGRIVEVSDHWLARMGYAHREEVIGRMIAEFHQPEHLLRSRQRVADFWSDREPVFDRESSFVRKDGSVFEAELSAVITGPEGNASAQSLSVVFDVTDRNRAWRELAIKNVALGRLNDELDTFASVASHDLQEPLRKIRKFSEVLEEELPEGLSEDGVYAMKVMRSAVKRMQTLIADLLDYARTAGNAIDASPVNLGEIAEGARDDLSVAIAEARAEIFVDTLPTVAGDALQLRQLFQNLIGNAIKYKAGSRACQIRITAQPGEGGGWCVRVEDNGIGFHPDAAEQIFMPFRRLQPRSAANGSGLGLTICSRIAERHGWSLRAHSTPGEGSTFTLEMPAPGDAAGSTA